MPTATRARFCLSGAVLLAVLFAACDTAPGPSLYDPIEDGTYQPPKPDPQLTSIAPAPGEALAGVTELTLSGQNFVPDPDSTFVYFNGIRYPVLSITPTEIRMRAPNLPRNPENPTDSLRVVVSVLRAENFTQTRRYLLFPAVERLGEQTPSVTPVGLTSDDEGNAYLSFLEAGTGRIRKSTSEGAYTEYGTPAPSTSVYQGMGFSAVDGLLGVRNNRAIYRITEGGSASGSPFIAFTNTALRLRALDIDADGNVWTAGTGTGLFYRVAPDQTRAEFPAPEGTVLAIEARQDYVYMSVVANEVNRIYRFARSGDSVGAAEEVVNITAAYPSVQVTALAFAANGDLFMGTSMGQDATNSTPMLELPAGGSLGELYDGLIAGNVVGLAWGHGSILYAAGLNVVGDTKSETTQGDLIQINTLREGER